jgi:hypothetical protein
MSEELMVKHCSPTLAGIKTASMYTCPCTNKASLCKDLREYNSLFRKKGMKILPLRFKNERALIYVYRPKKLEEDLGSDISSSILNPLGYDTDCPSKCLSQLMNKLQSQEDFPHEIGLFLGYPPKDVQGFIDHKAQDYKALGTWKVYDDVEESTKLFKTYDSCTKTYEHLLHQGIPFSSLVQNDGVPA